MNLLDIIIMSTMVFLILKGIFRGFIREIISLAGIILGIWLANHFQPQMTDYLKAYLPSTSFLPVISFAVIFTSILLLCNLLGWLLKLFFKKALLGWVDRTLGAGLAILKGVIITSLAIVLLTFFLPAKTPLIANSRLAPMISSSCESIINLISPDYYQELKRKIMEKKKEMDGILSEKVKEITEKNE